MSDQLDRVVIGVRADTGAFAADVAEMRAALEGPLVDGAQAAGQAIEATLLRAVRTGRLGFEDLRRGALSVMADIARSAISNALLGGGGGLLGLVGQVLGAALGAPGRATGGPVGPGRAYMVGERGPELFVPTSSGRIETGSARGGRDIRITVNVGGNGGGSDPQRMAASGRQIAQAVRRAIENAGD